MNDQERAKAAVEILERLTPWSQDHKKFIEATEFLRPIAAGKSVIVPIEPTHEMMMLGHKTLETKLSYMVHEVTVDVIYSAMIAASQGGE